MEQLSHPTPYIPPQCYAKTRDASGRVHNPCFACHQQSAPPNYVDDAALQLASNLPAPARRNPWSNLFVDRRKAVAEVTDEDILAYVRQSNYRAPGGTLLLAKAIESAPKDWDTDGNGRWDGWVPDIHYSFDERGFDRRPDGGYTGWRAFAYYPFPGAFWPTNGSTTDVLIRLPEAFRQDEAGRFDVAVYELNLAILEALITRRDVPIPPAQEARLGVDLDGDGRLGTARKIRFGWSPRGSTMSWVGRARALLAEGKVHLAAGLFPEQAELAHSIRYIDVVDGQPVMAERMKELHHMVKQGWLSYGALALAAGREAREVAHDPDATRTLGGGAEAGIGNGAGWRLRAFIEDSRGQPRPQTREEHALCVGCHSGVGATDDSVFSFGRKLPASAYRRGWFHWSQRGFQGLGEPKRADGQWEYTHYLQHAGGGDDFRGNTEVLRRFFTEAGALRPDAVRKLHRDISTLLLPSPERALLLDKAYRHLVREQSFLRGRMAALAPVANAHRELLEGEDSSTGVETPLAGPRDRGKP